MKKIIKNIFYIVSSTVLLVGCSEFLETQSLSTMTHTNYYQSVKDLEGALNASYESLIDGNVLGNYKKGISPLGELGTDEAFTFNTSNKWAVGFESYYTLNSLNEILVEFWTNAYSAINRNNEILAAIPNIKEESDRLDGIVGEAEFLQSLWYFNLVRNFGAVPLRTKPGVSSDDFVGAKRDSVSVIYKYIIACLRDAYTKLPDTRYQNEVGRAHKYSASGLLAKVYLNAASSMQLLQPKLTEEIKLDGLNSFEWTDVDDQGMDLSYNETIKYYYRKAAEYAKITIDFYGGEHCLEAGTLVGQFYPVESTRDVLFEAVFSQHLSPNQGAYFAFLFGPRGTLNNGGGSNVIAPISCYVVPNFTCSYDNATKTWASVDKRFLWSISTYEYNKNGKMIILNGTNVIASCKKMGINKFHPDINDLPPNAIGTGVNCPILRLSDVCLIYAEALGELSWMESSTISNEALKYLNIVRKNANAGEYDMEDVRWAEPIILHAPFNSIAHKNKEMKGYVTSTDIEHWRRTILNERMMELLGEGHRWYDLVRMGLLKQVVEGVTDFALHGQPVNRQISDFHVFRPIPFREIQVQQGNLKQNYGYY